MIKRISLQARLLALLILLLATLWTALLVDAQRSANDMAGREAHARLHGMADFLLTAAQWPEAARSDLEDILNAAGRPLEIDSLGAPAYEIRRGGTVLARSADFPTFRSRPEPGLTVAAGTEGNWIVLTAIDDRDDVTRRTALRQIAQDKRAEDLNAERTTSLNFLLPLFGIGVLGSIWFGLRPLRLIRQRITNINPNEPAQLGIEANRMPKEIADLAEAFDALVARLARVMTGQRIFTSVASHELRTPLAGAISQLDVLKRDPASPSARQRLTESLRHMDRLVSQLLALTREEVSASARGPTTFDIVSLVQDLREDLTRPDPALHIDLSDMHVPVKMTGYPDLIRSLLRNLVQNAVAASGHLPVSITLRAVADTVAVVVEDKGPGFPAHYQSEAFDPFARNIRGTASGTGLGLIVVHRIVELHQGRIEIADEPGGAKVTVILPRLLQSSKGG